MAAPVEMEAQVSHAPFVWRFQPQAGKDFPFWSARFILQGTARWTVILNPIVCDKGACNCKQDFWPDTCTICTVHGIRQLNWGLGKSTVWVMLRQCRWGGYNVALLPLVPYRVHSSYLAADNDQTLTLLLCRRANSWNVFKHIQSSSILRKFRNWSCSGCTEEWLLHARLCPLCKTVVVPEELGIWVQQRRRTGVSSDWPCLIMLTYAETG